MKHDNTDRKETRMMSLLRVHFLHLGVESSKSYFLYKFYRIAGGRSVVIAEKMDSDNKLGEMYIL
jgi:hypothetical protein